MSYQLARLPITAFITGLSLSSTAAVLAAQPEIASKEDKLEEIVVTASGYEQNILKAPASISVIGREELENRSYKDVTDALKSVPGVTITGGGSRQDISLRGMPADYTVILVDGKKQTGRETQPSSSGAFEQDWLPPLDAIDRIEVVRGPMSTLYGSDAIGGVINIITRKDFDSWNIRLRAEATIQDDSASGDFTQTRLYAAGPIVDNLVSASVTGLYQDREEDDIERGNGEKILHNYSAGLHLTPTSNDRFSLEFSHQDQQRIQTSGKTLPSRNSSSETNNNRNTFSLSHLGEYDWGVGSSYIQHETVENEGRDIIIDNTFVNSQWSLPYKKHVFSVGASYEKEDLEDKSTNEADITSISNDQYSLFVESEWQLADDFSLTLGVRVDDNQLFDMHISPRVYGVWQLDNSWSLKTGLSNGYRTPDLRDMSPDWIQGSRGGDIYGNPDLEPEISLNKEIGIYYVGDHGLMANLTTFHNDFEDKISLRSCPVELCGVADARYNVNIDSAVTQGAEAAVSMDITASVLASVSFTYTESEQKTGDNAGRPLVQIPENLISANVDWAVSDTVNSWVRFSYRSEESQAISSSSRAIQAPSASYVDLGGNWQVTDQFRIMLGIYNLLDEEVGYDEYGYVEDGIRYWVSLSASF